MIAWWWIPVGLAALVYVGGVLWGFALLSVSDEEWRWREMLAIPLWPLVIGAIMFWRLLTEHRW